MNTKVRMVLACLVLFLAVALIALPKVVRADPSNNPNFTTFSDVSRMISDALTPISSSIQNLASRVSNLETVVSPLPTQVQGLQNSVATQSAQISNLDTRVTKLEQNTGNSPNFQLDVRSYTASPNGSGNVSPEVSLKATYNGVDISGFLDLRGVAHRSSGDFPFAIQGYDFVIPDVSTGNTPFTLPIDVDAFWMGTTKHLSFSITGPTGSLSRTVVFALNRPQPFNSVWVDLTGGFRTMTLNVSSSGSISQYAMHYTNDPSSATDFIGFTEQLRVDCGGSTTCPHTTIPVLGNFYRISTGAASGNITATATLNP